MEDRKRIKVVNLCDHVINVGGVAIPPSGKTARVTVQRTPVTAVKAETEEGAPFEVQLNVTCAILGLGASGLPSRVDGTYYLVSRQVAEVAPEDRDDLLIVDETIKVAGRVVSAQSFARIKRVRD